MSCVIRRFSFADGSVGVGADFYHPTNTTEATFSRSDSSLSRPIHVQVQPVYFKKIWKRFKKKSLLQKSL